MSLMKKAKRYRMLTAALWFLLMYVSVRLLLRGVVGEFSAHGEGIDAEILYSRFAYFVPCVVAVFAFWKPRLAAVSLAISGFLGYCYLLRVKVPFVVANRHLLEMAFMPWIGLQIGLSILIYFASNLERSSSSAMP